MNPRSQVMSIGAEREVVQGLVRRRRLRAPALDRPRSHRRSERAVAVRSHGARTGAERVAAANATRPILPVNGGVRQVNVLMNLGVADYDGLQTQVSYRGNSKHVRRGQLHAVEGDQHHRAGRQRHRPEREQHRAARRGGARTERARSAPSRGHHVQLPVAVQHHGRHADAARVGASVQRHDRRRQQRRRRRTTTGRSSTAR